MHALQIAVMVLTFQAAGDQVNVHNFGDSDYIALSPQLRVLKYSSYLAQLRKNNRVTCTCNVPQMAVGLFSVIDLTASPFCPNNIVDRRTDGLPDAWYAFCVNVRQITCVVCGLLWFFSNVMKFAVLMKINPWTTGILNFVTQGRRLSTVSTI